MLWTATKRRPAAPARRRFRSTTPFLTAARPSPSPYEAHGPIVRGPAARGRAVGEARQLRVVLPWLRPGGVLLALLAPDELTPSVIKLLSARCEAVAAYRMSSSATSTIVIAGLKKADPGFDP